MIHWLVAFRPVMQQIMARWQDNLPNDQEQKREGEEGT
jgi:cytochrome b561